MFRALCGPPSSNSIFVSRLAMDILRLTGAAVPFLAGNSAARMVQDLKDNAARGAVLFFDAPEWRMVQAMLTSRVPVLQVTQPFEEVVVYAMVARGMTLEQSLRFAAQSASCLLPLALSPDTRVVPIEGRITTLAGLVDEIAAAWDLAVDDRVQGEIARAYLPNGHVDLEDLIRDRVEHARAAEARVGELTAQELALIGAMARTYRPVAEGIPVDRLAWPVPLLIDAAKPGSCLGAAEIDMVGPARFLAYGPYLHLYRGAWTADLTFAVFDNLSGNRLTVDIVADGGVVAAGTVDLPAEGVFRVSLPFRVEEAQNPVEVRILMMTGAIEGTFKPLEIVMVRREGGTGMDGRG